MQRILTIVAIILGAAAVMGLVGLTAWRLRDEQRLDGLARLLEAPPGDPAASLAGAEPLSRIPAPARRYLQRAIAQGAPLTPFVRLSFTGTQRLESAPGESGGQGWLSLTGNELLVPGHGFIWRAGLRGGLLVMSGYEMYAADVASSRYRLLGLWPYRSSVGDPDAKRAALDRLALESIWLPTALLPGENVSWETIDVEHAQVRLSHRDENVTLVFRVAPDGRLLEVSGPRWVNAAVGYVPYGYLIEEMGAFDGYSVPTSLRAGWRPGQPDFRETLQLHVTAASYR
jgi:hypothetical protein